MKNQKILTLAIVNVALLLTAFLLMRTVMPKTGLLRNREPSAAHTMLMALAHPKFVNDTLLKQITGSDAKLELLDAVNNFAYFSIEMLGDATLGKLTEHPDKVEFGRHDEERGGLVLGNFVLYKNAHFFRFPSADFRVNPEATISERFRRAEYRLSVKEFADFMRNRSIYGGMLSFQYGSLGAIPKTMCNHGAFVAKRNEPSLRRFVAQLTEASDPPEAVAQKLLNFVSLEIKYNFTEAYSNIETLKRADEVLLSKTSDCSGMAILYSSLLESAGIDHLLVYEDGHITVVVAGKFTNESGHSLTWRGKEYFYAEPTEPFFQIGRTRAEANRIIGIQKPGPNAPIVNAETGESFAFR